MKNKDLLEALNTQKKSLDLAERIAKLRREKRVLDAKFKTQMTKLYAKTK